MKQSRRTFHRVKSKRSDSILQTRGNLTACIWQALCSFGQSATLGLLAIAGVALTAFANSAAHAQTADFFAPPISGRETTVTLNAYETYDSNVSRSTEALAALRGIKQDDEIFAPSATADISRSFGLNTIYVSGAAGYNFYSQNHILDRQFANIAGGASTQIAACLGQVAGSFTSEQNDLEQLVGLTRQGVNNTQNIGKIGAKVSCERPGRLSPDASVTQTWSSNGSSLYSINNYNSLTGSGGVSYSRSSLGTARIFVQYTDTSYPDRKGLEGSTDEYDSLAVGASWSRKLGAKLQFTGSLLFSNVNTNGSGATSTGGFSGLTYDVDALYTPFSRLSAEINYTRSIAPSTLIGASYVIESVLNGHVDYALGVRSSATLGGSYSDFDYRGDTVFFTAEDIYSHEEIGSIYGDFNYKLWRLLSAKFDLRWETRTTNVSLYNYDDVRVGVTLTATY
jgi:hypothetical protein